MSTDIAPQPVVPNGSENPEFTVVGSGAVGLLVAKHLVEEGHTVHVISNEGKPEGGASTSSIAVGQFLPWMPEGHFDGVMADVELGEIVEKGQEFFRKLGENPHETGVMAVENVEFVSEDTPWPVDLPAAMGTTEQAMERPIVYVDPAGNEVTLAAKYEFDSFSINTRKTVPYLADQLEKLGVTFEQRALQPEDIARLDGVIVNAAGVGATRFDRGKEVKNFKGHTFVLQPREGFVAPEQALSVDDLVMMPREDGTVVCGALYLSDPINPIPESQEAEELEVRLGHLFKQAATEVKGLDPDLLDHSDIIMHSAGYRVELAEGGIRVAPDEENERLVHAYGFAGVGWSVGPHFAKVAADMAKQVHHKIKESS